MLHRISAVTMCFFIGFSGLLLAGAAHSPEVAQAKANILEAQQQKPKNKPTPTAADAAEVVCFFAERSRAKTTCTVDAFMHRIDMRVSAKKNDADKICLGMVDVISHNTRLFRGRGWTVRILPDNPNKPAHRNTDQPLAVCGIR